MPNGLVCVKLQKCTQFETTLQDEQAIIMRFIIIPANNGAQKTFQTFHSNLESSPIYQIPTLQ
jgi:hypothetical protein